MRHHAVAADLEWRDDFGPVVVVPDGELSCRVVVGGEAVGRVPRLGPDFPLLEALPPDAFSGVCEAIGEALARLRAEFDVVVTEGAGGAADLSALGYRDPANVLPLVADAVVLVARLSAGGAAGAAMHPLDHLPLPLRSRLRMVVINDVRTSTSELRSRLECAYPLGVMPPLLAGDPVPDPDSPDALAAYDALASAVETHCDVELLLGDR